MSPDTRPTLRRQDGAAAVEFALVSIALLAILYGLISFGVLFAVQHTLDQAATEGARAAVGAAPGDEAATSLAATRSDLGWLTAYVQPGDVTANLAPCSFDATVDCVHVAIDYPYGVRPVLPAVPGLGVIVPDHVTSEAVASIDS